MPNINMDNAVLIQTFARNGLDVEEYRVPVLTWDEDPSSALVAWIMAGALQDDKTQPLIAARYQTGSEADRQSAWDWVATQWDLHYAKTE